MGNCGSFAFGRGGFVFAPSICVHRLVEGACVGFHQREFKIRRNAWKLDAFRGISAFWVWRRVSTCTRSLDCVQNQSSPAWNLPHSGGIMYSETAETLAHRSQNAHEFGWICFVQRSDSSWYTENLPKYLRKSLLIFVNHTFLKCFAAKRASLFTLLFPSEGAMCHRWQRFVLAQFFL